MIKLNNRGKFALLSLLTIIFSVVMLNCCKYVPPPINEVIQIKDVKQNNPNDNFISFSITKTDSNGQEIIIDPSECEEYLEKFEINGKGFQVKEWNKIYLCKSEENLQIKFYLKTKSISQRSDTVINVPSFILNGKASDKAECPPHPLELKDVIVRQKKCSIIISIKNKYYKSNEMYFSISGPNGPWEKGKNIWKTPIESINKPLNVFVSMNESGNNPIKAYQTEMGDLVSDAGCDCTPKKNSDLELLFESKFNEFGINVNDRGKKRQFSKFLEKYQVNASYKGKVYDKESILTTLSADRNNDNLIFKAFNVKLDCEQNLIEFVIK
jgi:hypothetical protein